MTTPEELAARYGRTPLRRRTWVLLAIVLVLFAAAALWWLVAVNKDTVEATDLGYVIDSPHEVELRFSVAAPPGREIYCALEAMDEQFGVVGWKIVHLPASSEHLRAFTEYIPTLAPATTGLVNACWVS